MSVDRWQAFSASPDWRKAMEVADALARLDLNRRVCVWRQDDADDDDPEHPWKVDIETQQGAHLREEEENRWWRA